MFPHHIFPYHFDGFPGIGFKKLLHFRFYIFQIGAGSNRNKSVSKKLNQFSFKSASRFETRRAKYIKFDRRILRAPFSYGCNIKRSKIALVIFYHNSFAQSIFSSKLFSGHILRDHHRGGIH